MWAVAERQLFDEVFMNVNCWVIYYSFYVLGDWNIQGPTQKQ